MDSLKPKQKVNLICPKGHVLYKDGITARQLYQKCGIRLQPSQRVKSGVDWDEVQRNMDRMLKKMEEREGVTFAGTTKVWVNKDLKLCPTYQMTDPQMKSWRPCKYCAVTD